MSKPKRVNKTREELEVELNRTKVLEHKRLIIIEKFYPALVKATISVDESKALINAMGTLLMEEVLKTMKERSFSEIKDNLHKVLCQDGERSEEIRALLDSLEGENLYVSREIIEGMTRAIEAMITEEMRERKLDTLTPDWEKYLNR